MTLTTKCPEHLYIANLSDIHLGHAEVLAPEIIAKLRAAIPDNSETAKLDIIFFSGDVFDKLLALSHEYVLDIQSWIASQLRICKKHNIALRILRGTPLHDRNQAMQFESINTLAEIGADLKYVKDLSIEYIERYGITVLYVPDEWDHDPNNTLSQVHELLKAKGLTHVDYAVTHGLFDFQLPEVSSDSKHNSQEYLKIVRNVIMNGHDHSHKRFDRIFVPGSFDRLSHGQEEPKGHLRFKVRPGGDFDVEFVINHSARRFVTLDCTGLSVEDVLAKVEQDAGKLPDGSSVRIKAEDKHPIFSSMEILIRRWPMFDWKKKPVAAKTKELEWETETGVINVPSLTKHNLSDLLLSRVASKSPSGEILEAARMLLREVI